MSEFERRITFDPAYDCIRVQPCVHGSDKCRGTNAHGHGVHGVDMRWFLIGPAGVVQFVVYTGWHLDVTPPAPHGPMAADLGYHWPTPRYQEQTAMQCDLLSAGHCYYDGSGLNAKHPWRILREQGSEAVWSYLEDYYESLLQDA